MATVQPTWPEKLEEICRQRRLPTPVYTMISDRRGGRTAWGVAIDIRDPGIPSATRSFKSRFWYDVTRTDNAKNDAAQVTVETIVAQYPALKAIIDAMSARQQIVTTPTTVNPVAYPAANPAGYPTARLLPVVRPQPGTPGLPGVPNVVGQPGEEQTPGAMPQGQSGAESYTYNPGNPNVPRGQ